MSQNILLILLSSSLNTGSWPFMVATDLLQIESLVVDHMNPEFKTLTRPTIASPMPCSNTS